MTQSRTMIAVTRWLWTFSALGSLAVAVMTTSVVYVVQAALLTIIAIAHWSRR